jgi:hypothetical protein
LQQLAGPVASCLVALSGRRGETQPVQLHQEWWGKAGKLRRRRSGVFGGTGADAQVGFVHFAE